MDKEIVLKNLSYRGQPANFTLLLVGSGKITRCAYQNIGQEEWKLTDRTFCCSLTIADTQGRGPNAMRW